MNRRDPSAAPLLFAGAVFLFIGLRGEPRQAVWVVLGSVFLAFGLARLVRGRARR